MPGPSPEQQKIIEALDRPLFVAAGAGSGKSTTLANRVVWALTPGSAGAGAAYLTSIDEALIITFTNAAAAEIREKVRRELLNAGMFEQALAVDGAWISTIHGMCSRILKRHALDLGIDPAFKMISETAQKDLEQQAQALVARQIRAERNPYPVLFGEFAQTTDDQVYKMAAELRRDAANAPEGFAAISFPGTDTLVEDYASYQEILQEALAVGEEAGEFSSKTGVEQFEALTADAARLAACSAEDSLEDVAHVAELVAQLTRPMKNYGSKGFKTILAELQDRYDALQIGSALARMAPAATELVELAERIDAAYSALKHEQGVLDNDDLIRMAFDALRSHPEIAQEYAHRFKLVMIDEFQDTNAQQLKMIELLSGKDACHLCTVGDAQQSIYRFRSADVEVFRQREATVRDDERLKLTTNYRSHADVLQFVEQLLGHGLLRDYMHLEPNPERRSTWPEALPRITMELALGGNVATHTELEAKLIAARLQQMSEQGVAVGDMALLLGKMSNLDTFLGALRTRGLDCVVSGGSTFSKAPEVAVVAALAHTLANPHDTEIGLFPVLTSEMFQVSADDLCILATGQQETRDSLKRRGIERGFMSFDFVEGAEPSDQLMRAKEVLDRACERLGSWPVGELLGACVRESGWIARMEAAGTQGQARLANVLAAIRYLAELADEAGLGLARAAFEFDQWLKVAQVGPASLMGAGAGAIRIMTIHASKGLQFPAVAVADCWQGRSQNSGGLTLHTAGDKIYATLAPKGMGRALTGDSPALKDCTTKLDWARALVAAETQGEDEEAARKLYVALTRAEEALVLGISVGVTSKGVLSANHPLVAGVLAAAFGEGLPEAGSYELDFGGSVPAQLDCLQVTESKEELQLVGGAALGLDEPCALDTALDERGGPVAEASPAIDLYAVDVADGLTEARHDARPWNPRADVFSYSAVQAALDAAAPHSRPRSAPHDGSDEAPVAADLADADRATNLGSAFHLLAQGMVETGVAPTEERIAATCAYWQLTDKQVGRLRAALARWEHSAIRAEALRYDMLRAELPFFAKVDDVAYGQFVEGYIDLLATNVGSTEALVIDYKTGDRELSPAEIRARHELQANFYAWVLTQHGFTTVSCAFVCVEREDEAGEPYVCRYAFDATRPPSLTQAAAG